MIKKEKTVPKREANLFDKVLKENLPDLFTPYIEKEFGEIKSKKILKQKLQTTLERELDYLYEVTFKNGSHKKLIHIEFQASLTADIIYRMGEYHGIIHRQYKLPVEHIVIYLGEAKRKIKTMMSEEEVFKSFKLVKLNEEDPFKLLETNSPSNLLISILTNIPMEQMDNYLRLLKKKVKSILKDENKISKFVQQLLVLTRLRNFDKKIIDNLRKMPITIDIEKDILYQEGVEKGIKKGIAKGRVEGIETGISKHEYIVLKNGIKNNYKLKDLSIILGISVQKVSALIKKYKIK